MFSHFFFTFKAFLLVFHDWKKKLVLCPRASQLGSGSLAALQLQVMMAVYLKLYSREMQTVSSRAEQLEAQRLHSDVVLQGRCESL